MKDLCVSRSGANPERLNVRFGCRAKKLGGS